MCARGRGPLQGEAHSSCGRLGGLAGSLSNRVKYQGAQVRKRGAPQSSKQQSCMLLSLLHGLLPSQCPHYATRADPFGWLRIWDNMPICLAVPRLCYWRLHPAAVISFIPRSNSFSFMLLPTGIDVLASERRACDRRSRELQWSRGSCFMEVGPWDVKAKPDQS